jgi:hypothetical protein
MYPCPNCKTDVYNMDERCYLCDYDLRREPARRAEEDSRSSSGYVSGLDAATEIRRLRDALRRLEREICTNPTPEKLDIQLAIIAEALE